MTGGPGIDSRLSPVNRPGLAIILNRVPSLLNAPLDAPFFGFDENIPLRDQPS